MKTLWKRASKLELAGIGAILKRHDAMGSLELMEQLESA